MRALRHASWTILASLLVAFPGLAHACAVCMSGRDDETRTAFILTTGFMTALPLVVLGAAAWWLRRRLGELEGGVSRDPAPGAEGGPPPGPVAPDRSSAGR